MADGVWNPDGDPFTRFKKIANADDTYSLAAQDTVSAPGNDLVECTKSDATDDPAGPFRAFIMDAEGLLKVTTDAGTDREYPVGLFAAQTVYELRFTRIWSTGTGPQNVFGFV